MRKIFILTLICFFISIAFAQTTIKGTVASQKKETIPGANIILQNTYDGTSTDSLGNFQFTTDEKGKYTLLISCVGFENVIDTLLLNGTTINKNYVLKEKFNELKAVVISAGSFEASDEKKAVMLRPLDIVTTAGAEGDIYGALQTLPGASKVGNDDGLYVRGGSDYETKTIIDGLTVQNPYYSSVPDVPSRGRFAPFLFKGTVFSTGGYSAEYGQALSSAVILNSEDMPEQSVSGLSLSPIFAGAFTTQVTKNKKTAIGGGLDYTNIGLYDNVFKPRTFDWLKSVEAGSGTIYFRQKTSKTGLIKFYGQFERSQLGIRFPNIDSLAEGVNDDLWLRNNYNYVNASYKEIIAKNWSMNLAAAYSNNFDSTTFNGLNVTKADDAIQSKLTFNDAITEKVSLRFGGEWQAQQNTQYFDIYKFKVNQNYAAAFAESDIFITNDFAGRIGVRSEYSAVLNKFNLAPRISLAYKVGENGQVSFAYGDFYEVPQPTYLYAANTDSLTYERATHYIANYQVITNERTFRIEAYYKKYKNLISFNNTSVFPGNYYNTTNGFSDIANNGGGYARGFDIFYRDKKTIKNADYWISYSFLDTKRKFLNYPKDVQPTFAADHVLSVVYKQYISKIHTQLGATYRYISGWPYYNPNSEDYLSDVSPAYNDISFNASYLTNIKGNFTVVFISLTNLFGFNQVYSYIYSSEDPGVFIEQRPPLKRSFFIGMFISISKNQQPLDDGNE